MYTTQPSPHFEHIVNAWTVYIYMYLNLPELTLYSICIENVQQKNIQYTLSCTL